MAFPRVMTADEAARLVPDGSVVTVSSSSGLGCPDAVLAAIGRRFQTEGRPRGITTIHPIAAEMLGSRRIKPRRFWHRTHHSNLVGQYGDFDPHPLGNRQDLPAELIPACHLIGIVGYPKIELHEQLDALIS